MKITSLAISNFRSFESTAPIPLLPLNVFIGANNAGKSSILRAAYLFQDGAEISNYDVRLGAPQANVSMEADGIQWPAGTNYPVAGTFGLSISASGSSFVFNSQTANVALGNTAPFRATNPLHAFVPYLSKRKTSAYSPDVGMSSANSIGPTLSNLTARLANLGTFGFPRGAEYVRICTEILGFPVVAVPSPQGGRQPGVFARSGVPILIDRMGEGVANIVGLLADLVLSDGKIFLVEEPENDLHPEALKALLSLIIESSSRNQFIVSTHSNIVLRHLGAERDCLVYEVGSDDRSSIPATSWIRQLAPTPEARFGALEKLGYSLTDFELWDGWLILEEASAERIVRDYLIPWFAPELRRVRTISGSGAARTGKLFDDFKRIVLFAHLEPAYRRSTWVRVDDDDAGREVIARLRRDYGDWDPERFDVFPAEDFELFYPTEFQPRVEAVLALSGEEKREAKRTLLEEVRQWIDENPARGRAALETTAAAVIEDLRAIEREFLAGRATA